MCQSQTEEDSSPVELFQEDNKVIIDIINAGYCHEDTISQSSLSIHAKYNNIKPVEIVKGKTLRFFCLLYQHDNVFLCYSM